MTRFVVFVLVLFIARGGFAVETHTPTKSKTAAKKRPVSKPVQTNELDLDLELDLDPADPVSQPVDGLDFDLDLDPLPPVEPPPLPAENIPPTAEQKPVDVPPESQILPILVLAAPVEPAPPLVLASPSHPPRSAWRAAAGVVLGGSVRRLTTADGLSLSDGGSTLMGFAARVRYIDLALQIDWRYVREDRQLVATVRSDSGREYTVRVSYLGWNPFDEIGVNLGLAARRRSHTGSPQAGWWATHGIDPIDTDLAFVPAIEWPFTEYLVLTAALHLGYGWGSINAHAFRDFSGPFADVEVGLLVPTVF